MFVEVLGREHICGLMVTGISWATSTYWCFHKTLFHLTLRTLRKRRWSHVSGRNVSLGAADLLGDPGSCPAAGGDSGWDAATENNRYRWLPRWGSPSLPSPLPALDHVGREHFSSLPALPSLTSRMLASGSEPPADAKCLVRSQDPCCVLIIRLYCGKWKEFSYF